MDGRQERFESLLRKNIELVGAFLDHSARIDGLLRVRAAEQNCLDEFPGDAKLGRNLFLQGVCVEAFVESSEGVHISLNIVVHQQQNAIAVQGR